MSSKIKVENDTGVQVISIVPGTLLGTLEIGDKVIGAFSGNEGTIKEILKPSLWERFCAWLHAIKSK